MDFGTRKLSIQLMTNTIIQPTIIYIFGGSGDLTSRKLIPALYNLYIDKYLPEKYSIIGIGRNPFTNTEYRSHSKKGVQAFRDVKQM